MEGTKRKKRWGDLRYGRLLRSLDPIYKFMPFIMKDKNDSTNYYVDSFDISAVEDYIKEKRREGYKGFGILHIFLATYLRIVAQRPAANRFIQGQRIYSRNNIEVIMAVKQKMSIDADESMIKMVFSPHDTVFDVYEKINKYIAEVKDGAEGNKTDNTAAALSKMPRFLLRFVMAILRALDYYGKLPKALLDASPFHGSIVITDLGSLGVKPCLHHIYNFGNIPAFLAFGAKRREYVADKDGNIREKRLLDYSFSLDERICDGFYFATILRDMKTCFRHPEMLETPPEQVLEDVD